MSFYSLESMKIRQFVLSYAEVHMAHLILKFVHFQIHCVLEKEIIMYGNISLKVTNYTILAIILFFLSNFFSCFHTRKKNSIKSVLFHWNVIKEITKIYTLNK